MPERLNDGRNNLRKPTQNWFQHPSRDAELPSARLRRIDGSRLAQLLGLSGSCLVSFIAESLGEICRSVTPPAASACSSEAAIAGLVAKAIYE